MRKEMLVFAAITALALAAVAVFGGAFKLRPVDEPLQPLYAPPSTKVLPDPVPGGHGWKSPEQRSQQFELELQIKAAGTGAFVPVKKLVTIKDGDGRVLDLSGTDLDSLAINSPFGVPVWLTVEARGWFSRTIGPFVRWPGVMQSHTAWLSKPQPVTFAGASTFDGQRVTVFGAAPPDDTHAFIYRQSAVVDAAGAIMELAPGPYWCVVHADMGSQWRGMAFTDQVLLQAIDVRDEPMVVDLNTLRRPELTTLSGVVVDESGVAVFDAEVRVEMLGHCGLTLPVGEGTTNTYGRFSIPVTMAEIWRIRVDVGCGRAEAVVFRDQQNKPLTLRLRPWVGKERGVFPASPVGGVQILKRGKPLRGARLIRHWFGTFTSAWSDSRTPVLGEAANEEGVITEFGQTPKNFVVFTTPWSAAPFELRYRPGSSARAVFEIAPPGTGSLRVEFGEDQKRFHGLGIRSANHEQTWSGWMEAGEDGVFEIFGLKPGKYTFRALDENWLAHHREFEVRAD
jgi:hypothetical protein